MKIQYQVCFSQPTGCCVNAEYVHSWHLAFGIPHKKLSTAESLKAYRWMLGCSCNGSSECSGEQCMAEQSRELSTEGFHTVHCPIAWVYNALSRICHVWVAAHLRYLPELAHRLCSISRISWSSKSLALMLIVYLILNFCSLSFISFALSIFQIMPCGAIINCF